MDYRKTTVFFMSIHEDPEAPQAGGGRCRVPVALFTCFCESSGDGAGNCYYNLSEN